jgi:uncharacterized damage-inducible protein DinB
MSPVIPARVIPHRRLDVPFAGDEKAMLAAFLDRYRETILWKLEGLTKEQASARLVPSVTTLLGIVKHLAYVERGWFPIYFGGEPPHYPWAEDEPDQDIDFRVEPADTVESVSALYQQEIARSRDIVASASLDDLSKQQDRGPRSLRWIMVHMIEETARHAGHADILRELTDGAIGQ